MEDLTYWDFKDELLKLPAKTRKLSNKTARQKVEDVFDKYRCLVAISKNEAERNKKQMLDLENICKALQSGVVKYREGFFKVSEITNVEVTETNIKVYFKNGKEENFTKSFDWLKKLF